MRTPLKCRSLILPVFLLGLSGLLHNPVEAQIYAEVRGGTAVGSHTATAAAMELEPGLSVAGLISLQTSGALGLYAGFVRTQFGCSNGFCTDRDITFAGNDARLGLSLSRGGLGCRWAYSMAEPEPMETSLMAASESRRVLVWLFLQVSSDSLQD